MVTIPENTEGLIYFTRRNNEDGKIMAWVYKKECPECKKAKMGKPKDPKTGRPKIRAKEYICPECDYSEEKKEHEETLTVEIQYTCPHCNKSGETTTPCKRKSFKGVQSYVFTCNDCGEKMGVTKKMKKTKKKK